MKVSEVDRIIACVLQAAFPALNSILQVQKGRDLGLQIATTLMSELKGRCCHSSAQLLHSKLSFLRACDKRRALPASLW